MPRALVLSCVFVLTIADIAAAEWHFTPMVGLTFKGNTTINDPEQASGDVHRDFGAAVSLLSGGVLGVEAVFVRTPGFFDSEHPPLGDLVDSSRSYALMGNLVATLPRHWTEYSLRPFVSGGFGLMAVSKEEKVAPVDLHLSGLNVGGGAIGFLSKRVGLRFDMRYYKNLRRTNEGPGVTLGTLVHVRYMCASVGLVIRR